MRTAALYLRASTDHQKYSTANQADALRKYAAKHEFVVVRTYADDGRSGLNLRGRPALRQLLQDVLGPNCPFGGLLVYDVSRWGRFQDADESAYYEHLCKRAGVRIVYAAEPFESDDSPMGNVMKSIKRAMAAEYSRELSRKVQLGQQRLAKLGYSQGGDAGYGLRRLLVDQDRSPKGVLGRGDHKAFQTDRVVLMAGPTEEVAVVNRIFRMFVLDGAGEQRIARELNAEGLASPSGGVWLRRTIALMLRNERYIGNYVYNRASTRLLQARKPNPPDQWVRKNGALEGIVAAKTFARAQAIFASRKRYETKETMLSNLEALFQREGSLSKRMIDKEPGILGAAAYARRFGSLTNVYRLVGMSCADFTTIGEHSRTKSLGRAGLLQKLSELWVKKGRLSTALINADPGTPRATTYQTHFGSLTNAYRLIGFDGPARSRVRPKAIGQPP